jgi:hypothetical protein
LNAFSSRGHLKAAHILTAELGRAYVYSIATQGAFTAATELSPLVFASTSNTNMIAIDGLYLDIIEMSLPTSQEAIPLSLDEVITHSSGIARVVDFKEIFTSKMKRGSYPTGEDRNIAFARCVLLDNEHGTIRMYLDQSVTIERMVAMWEERYERFANITATLRSTETFNHPKEEEKDLRTDPYIYALLAAARKCTYFVTKSGYIGVGPNNAMAGDVVAIFSGATTPFVLRKAELDDSGQATPSLTGKLDDRRWKIIGSCYLHGFMDNEVASPEWQDKRQMIWLV